MNNYLMRVLERGELPGRIASGSGALLLSVHA